MCALSIDSPIEAFEVSVRTRNVCLLNGWETLRQVRDAGKAEFLRAPHAGLKSWSEIERCVAFADRLEKQQEGLIGVVLAREIWLGLRESILHEVSGSSHDVKILDTFFGIGEE